MRPYQIYNPGPTILSGLFLSAEQEKQRRIGNNNPDYLIISEIFAKFAILSVGYELADSHAVCPNRMRKGFNTEIRHYDTGIPNRI